MKTQDFQIFAFESMNIALALERDVNLKLEYHSGLAKKRESKITAAVSPGISFDRGSQLLHGHFQNP